MSNRAGSAEFHAARAEIGELHDKKQADYGAEGDPFANIRQTQDWGVPASMGACMRIGDKVSRLKTFYRTGELANESVEDAFLDLAVYALIGLCLFREEQATKATADRTRVRCPRCFGAGSLGDDACRVCDGNGYASIRPAVVPPRPHIGKPSPDATATCVLCHGFLSNHDGLKCPGSVKPL